MYDRDMTEYGFMPLSLSLATAFIAWRLVRSLISTFLWRQKLAPFPIVNAKGLGDLFSQKSVNQWISDGAGLVERGFQKVSFLAPTRSDDRQ